MLRLPPTYFWYVDDDDMRETQFLGLNGIVLKTISLMNGTNRESI